MLLSRSIRGFSTNINRQLLTKRQILGQHKFVRKQSKLLTLPNVLTMSRIVATPGIGYFIWNGMNTEALTLFAFAGLTDMLDGWVARRFNKESEVGAILDPIADKFLLTTCFVTMYNVELMPLWIVKGFIARDIIIVSGGIVIRYFSLDDPSLKRFFDFKNYPTVGFEPTLVAKCNTFLQICLIATHLGCSHMVGQPTFDWSLMGLQGLTALTTMISLTQYMVRALFTPVIEAKPRPPKG